MPLRHQPPALRRAAMSAIAQNFELLCYGVKSRQQMSELLQSEQYLSVSGPLQDLPMGLLEDITEEMKHVTHLRKHHLHMLLTPTITTWRSHGVGDLLVAFPLLVLRCKG